MTTTLAPHMDPKRSFQALILTLHNYWADKGCAVLQPYDMEVGAGTLPGNDTARARPQALEGRLCSTLAPPLRRPLW